MPAPVSAVAASGPTAALLALLRTPGLGANRLRRLLQRHGSAEAVFAAKASAWAEAGCSEGQIAGLANPDHKGAETDLCWLAASPRHHFIDSDHPAWPARLAEIPAAPFGLFALGDIALLGEPQLAIVGARAASTQGRNDAQAFAEGLARAGLVITSGLALGIDAAAHRGALDAGGTTIAVCGNGLDRVYPARNRELALAIAERGLLVSEFPPGTVPRPEHFPRRNRIISGLSLGVLVIEAQLESGSLITARLAAEQGREVFALPGSIHNPMARGCHALIRNGATLTETVADILVELAAQLKPMLSPAAARAEPMADAPVDSLEQRVLAAIGDQPVAIDQLASTLALGIAELGAALLSLELQGLIEARRGDCFSRLHRRR
ncbi:DNA-processing protein DprA [uncultured Nevskia sp.]|uniref:DNA-processing protein DprA n=1 Tax=uncultured Nevskia sp. TaxID=228950 RepID=UPI0025D6F2C7|nr:DNA-processing protein DprA [uncultured Nevskia sp.]